MEENDTPASGAGSGLLVAARKIAAARARTEQPSDVCSGRSDGND